MKKLWLAIITLAILIFPLGHSVYAETRYAYFDVKTTDPLIGGSDKAPLDKVISIYFTRQIDRGVGSIEFTENGVPFPFTEEINGSVLLIKPSKQLNPSKMYVVTLNKNAIVNGEKNDNSKSTLRDKYMLTFRTIDVKPNIQQTTQQQQVVQIQPQQPVQPTQAPVQQSQDVVLLEKGKPASYKINGQPSNYAVRVSDPKVAHAQVQNGHLIINGIAEGAIQVAIRNTVNNSKVVLNVKVVDSVLNL